MYYELTFVKTTFTKVNGTLTTKNNYNKVKTNQQAPFQLISHHVA